MSSIMAGSNPCIQIITHAFDTWKACPIKMYCIEYTLFSSATKTYEQLFSFMNEPVLNSGPNLNTWLYQVTIPSYKNSNHSTVQSEVESMDLFILIIFISQENVVVLFTCTTFFYIIFFRSELFTSWLTRLCVYCCNMFCHILCRIKNKIEASFTTIKKKKNW